MKQIIGFGLVQNGVTGIGMGDVKAVDSDFFDDMREVAVRFAGQSAAPNAISMCQQFLGQPGTDKTANSGDIGLNFDPPGA
jgi:hypothetical protein